MKEIIYRTIKLVVEYQIKIDGDIADAVNTIRYGSSRAQMVGVVAKVVKEEVERIPEDSADEQ